MCGENLVATAINSTYLTQWNYRELWVELCERIHTNHTPDSAIVFQGRKSIGKTISFVRHFTQ